MRRLQVVLLAGAVLAAGLAAYGIGWAAREVRSHDVCITGTPAGGVWVDREESLTPWRWTCVYESAGGGLSRVAHSTLLP